MIRHARFIVPALAGLALGACSDGAPESDALVSLIGTVENHRTTAPQDVTLYLVWDGGWLQPTVAVELDTAPTFPVRFQLDVFERPDVFPPANPVPQESTWAGAYVVAARPGTVFADENWRDDPGVLGIDPRHILFYIREDVPFEGFDKELARIYYHGEQAPGFQMLEKRCISPARAAEIRACLEAHPHPPGGGVLDNLPIREACGVLDPAASWIQRAPDGLKTELSVEMLDDLSSWRPDPSECI